MLNLMKGALGPSISYQDKIMYMTSLEHNHSIHSDNNVNNAAVLENIFHLLSSANTRYVGLQLLQVALQQNSNQFYHKGKWPVMTYGIIRDSHAANIEKIQACKVLSMVIPSMASDSSASDAKDELIKEIYPVLLENIKKNMEWAEEACNCVKICLRTFPNELAFYEQSLMQVILHQALYNVSSSFFEVLAECFCELPYCSKDNSVATIQGRWNNLYNQTLKTIETLQIDCLKHKKNCDQYDRTDNEAEEFVFNERNSKNGFYQDHLMNVRCFVNMCKCLAKLLSVQSKYSVKVPVGNTIHCLIPVYTRHRKEKLGTTNEEIFYTFITQMQLAGLVVLESLIVNCNVQKNATIMRDLMLVIVMESCKTPFSSELVSELRVATWKLLSLWLEGYGRSVSKGIAERSEIIQELLKDINIDASESQQMNNTMKASNKSTKTTSSGSKSILMKKNQQNICLAALNSLESLLYTGTLDMSKGVFQEICNRVFNICHILHSSCDPFPFPYNDESCREKLYSVVLTIVVVIKPDEAQILQTAMKILTDINKDPSFKIRKFSNKASVIYRLLLYPRRPLLASSDNKLRRPNCSSESLKYPEWSSEDYVQNLTEENVSETLENVGMKVESSFQIKDDVEVHSEEYMDIQAHYPEQVVENQCNGEDMLEIQSTSHCQDDDESDEEEEEEEEDRSYIEEEMNQEEAEHEIYIPSSRKVQVSSTPIQINSETVQSINEPEYVELAQCVKIEENSFNNSTEDKCVNGEEDVIHDNDMPSSSSQQIVTNENGIFGIDEDDIDEENEEEDEEEESYPAEKKESSGAEVKDGPPHKKPRIETTDDAENNEKQERPQSPTMDEMKASLMEILPSEEDVRSGKIQLSASCQL